MCEWCPDLYAYRIAWKNADKLAEKWASHIWVQLVIIRAKTGQHEFTTADDFYPIIQLEFSSWCCPRIIGKDGGEEWKKKVRGVMGTMQDNDLIEYIPERKCWKLVDIADRRSN